MKKLDLLNTQMAMYYLSSLAAAAAFLSATSGQTASAKALLASARVFLASSGIPGALSARYAALRSRPAPTRRPRFATPGSDSDTILRVSLSGMSERNQEEKELLRLRLQAGWTMRHGYPHSSEFWVQEHH